MPNKKEERKEKHIAGDELSLGKKSCNRTDKTLWQTFYSKIKNKALSLQSKRTRKKYGSWGRNCEQTG